MLVELAFFLDLHKGYAFAVVLVPIALPQRKTVLDRLYKSRCCPGTLQQRYQTFQQGFY